MKTERRVGDDHWSDRDGMKRYIEARSIPVPFAGCWLWTASLGSHGYGNAFWRGVITVAHRLSFMAFHGLIPGGMLVQHSCDTRSCVNPDHLSIGTDATNAEDKSRKGRAAKKLDRDSVARLLQMHAQGTPQRRIALALGVTQRAVWQHIHRKAA
jgi:HNH endonuclease